MAAQCRTLVTLLRLPVILQVPNISRQEYTLVDINEEGFVSSLARVDSGAT
jgi:hypothetical protein